MTEVHHYIGDGCGLIGRLTLSSSAYSVKVGLRTHAPWFSQHVAGERTRLPDLRAESLLVVPALGACQGAALLDIGGTVLPVVTHDGH